MIRKKSERGQSLVEMAISITVLVFLLSGAVEFGMMYFQYIQLRDAAQEGALYGSLNPADASRDSQPCTILINITYRSLRPRHRARLGY